MEKEKLLVITELKLLGENVTLQVSLFRVLHHFICCCFSKYQYKLSESGCAVLPDIFRNFWLLNNSLTFSVFFPVTRNTTFLAAFITLPVMLTYLPVFDG